MEAQIHWYKKWYESQYQLFLDEQQIGEVSLVAFSSKTVACLYGKKYIFRPKGIWLRKIEITDAASQEPVGKIYFTGAGIKGMIRITPGDSFQLHCINILTAQWAIAQGGHDLITYTGNFMEGKIKADHSNPLLLLAGLYASIFQRRKILLLLMIVVPLILIIIRTI